MTTAHQLLSDVPEVSSIGDYGLIGDMRTAALVDRWGRMDWLCWPRFDSPPLLRRLIDPDAGGSWQVAPAVPFAASRRYLPDTNVLETTFSCRDGTAIATEFMAVPREDRSGSLLVRMVEGRSGVVPIHMALRASSGFGEGSPPLRVRDGVLLIGGTRGTAAAITATEPVSVEQDEATLDAVLHQGQRMVIVLTSAPVAEVATQALTARDTTARWWREWIGRCNLPGIKRDVVVRSALALKLLHHQPTSALVAAPTTSLPERIGGSRNWDYRYTWLRDSSMMTLALQRLGHHDEAMGFWNWLAGTARRHGDDLSVAYTLDGDPVPEEYEAKGLPGYRESQPVRVGNTVAAQRQHDIYGHVLAAAAHCYHHMDMDVAAPRAVLRRIADLAAQRWNRPDDAIWEIRGQRTHHTYSRLMCWLALDRAVDLARHGALDGDSATWEWQRDLIRRTILKGAWNPTVRAFTGTIGGDELDAATLVAPLIGFLPADDPRCRSTRQVITDRLGENGLLRRYRYDDGLGDPDGAFLLCNLWLADTHTLDHDPERGEELIDRVLRTGNDLGLLAEEADPATDEPLGNYPQGLTHLGIIHSVHRLAAASETQASGNRL